MSQDRYIYLIYKEFNDTLNNAEFDELKQWLEASPEHATLKDEVLSGLSNLDAKPPVFEVDVESDYAKVAAQLGFKGKLDNKPSSGSRIYVWLLIGAFLVGIGAAAFYYQSRAVEKPALRALNAGNEIKEVQLADGSTVKLNAGSILEYPESFDGLTRSVHLKGEAFFNIEKDASKPFIVITDQSKVEVLGTSFNVREDLNNYETTVSVLSGKVQLTSTQDLTSTVVLTKNQKGIIDKAHKAYKVNSDNLNAVAWESGKLRFRSTPVGEVFGDMAAFYNVSIINKSSIPEDCTYSMSGQEITLDRLLENMNQIFLFDIERKEDNIILISGGNCN